MTSAPFGRLAEEPSCDARQLEDYIQRLQMNHTVALREDKQISVTVT